MISLRTLLIFSLIFSTVSCSQKKSKPTEKQKVKTESAPTAPAPAPAPSKPATETPKATAPASHIERYVDHNTSNLIQKLRADLQNSLKKNAQQGIKNIQFANRISRVEFAHGANSKLKIATHSDNKVYNFEQLSAEGNIQYFNAYTRSFLNGQKRAIYAAEVETIKTNNKILSIIKLKYIQTHEVVSIIYLKKSGTITTVYREGYDYTRELTPTSEALLENTLENPKVVGEFYDVITEGPNNSSASRFDLVVSDNFKMSSQPYSDYLSTLTPVPLSLNYSNFFKMAVGGSAAYTSIREPVYMPISQRNPVELTTLVLNMTLDAKEKIKGQKHTVPIQYVVQFSSI